MKFDVGQLRYIEKAQRARRRLLHISAADALAQDAWRTLTAVEMGMKNHELVPSQLVDAIAGLRNGTSSRRSLTFARRLTPRSLAPVRASGGAFKQMRLLLKHKLVHHENAKYDGFRLTPLVRAPGARLWTFSASR
jgi:RIO kinase 2